jgi:hypothetical protein
MIWAVSTNVDEAINVIDAAIDNGIQRISMSSVMD